MNYDLVVVGHVSIDTMIKVPFLPRWNSECMAFECKVAHGGGAANVAAYAAFHGGLRTCLISAVGNDRVGSELLTRLSEYNVHTDCVKIVDGKSSTSIVILLDKNDRYIFLVDLAAGEEIAISQDAEERVKSAGIVYVGPSNPKVHRDFIAFSFSRQKKIAFNPGSVYLEQNDLGTLNKLIGRTDILFLSDTEALEYSQKNSPEEAGQFFKDLGVEIVVVTLGKAGCMILSDTRIFVPGNTVRSSTSIGAGDAFAAGFLSGYLRKKDLETAARLGNLFAAYAIKASEVRRINPSQEEFVTFLKQQSAGNMEPLT